MTGLQRIKEIQVLVIISVSSATFLAKIILFCLII